MHARGVFTCANVLYILEYWPRLLFESGDYFFLHCWKCGDNSRAASDRVNTVAIFFSDLPCRFYLSCLVPGMDMHAHAHSSGLHNLFNDDYVGIR